MGSNKPTFLLVVTLVALALVALSACNTTPGVIRVCLVDETKAFCNKGKVHTEPAFPAEMGDYVVFDEVALDLFMSRKEDCLQAARHDPSNTDTLRDMLPCVIAPTKPALTVMPVCQEVGVPGNLAVDRISWGKMKNFLEYCGESSAQ